MRIDPWNEVKTFEAITRGSRNNTRRDLIIQFTDDWLFHGSARVKRLSILDPCQGMFNRGVGDRVISSLILATTLSVKGGYDVVVRYREIIGFSHRFSSFPDEYPFCCDEFRKVSF